MSRVLVTGACGFIGSHVVDRLVAAGHEPRLFDRRPSPYHPDADLVLGDVCDVDELQAAMVDCDAVMHLAAAADVGEVVQAPVDAEELNARGTLAVLEAARLAGVDRVVYASTIWVYSDVEAETVDEETPLEAPAHLYSASKLAGELYCRSYRELYGVHTTVLRFGIPYGPRARPAAVVPAFVRKALAGEPLTIAGGGLQSRRFVYVEDLAEGVVRALAPQAEDRTYNLVSDVDVTIRQIAETVQRVVGDVELVEVEGRAGDFGGAQVSGERAAAELGWRATTPFEEGLRRYVAWYRDAGETSETRPTPVATLAAAPAARRTWSERLVRARSVALARPLTITAVGLIAGALAVALTRSDAFSDPVALLATLALLAIPGALIAGVDWSRDRVDAAVVLVTMVAGALVALVWNWAGDLAREAAAHPWDAGLLAIAVVSATGGVRAWRAARV